MQNGNVCSESQHLEMFLTNLTRQIFMTSNIYIFEKFSSKCYENSFTHFEAITLLPLKT